MSGFSYPACLISQRRLRRRGPRSIQSLIKRAVRTQRTCPVGEVPGESRAVSSSSDLQSQPLNLYVCNIRSIINKIGELSRQLELYDVHVVLIQETWLDASYLTVHLPNYVVLGRRDRNEDVNRGGVITYARCDVKNHVSLKSAVDGERCWHLAQRDSDRIAVCNNYLPPGNSEEQLEVMEAEVQEMLQKYDNVILAGDFNIHHRVWLKHSREDTGMGSRLKDICDKYGLKQLVKEPTRGEYLLDLVLTNRNDVRVCVLSKIADHCGHFDNCS